MREDPVGAALAAYHIYRQKPRQPNDRLDGMQGAYLGPSFSDDECAARLKAMGARFVRLEGSGSNLKGLSRILPVATCSAGSKDVWNLDRARWAIARS